MKLLFGRNEPKKKGGNKLNMVIAKTHQLSSRLVGMQLTSGNLIGVVLSMCQMSLGFVFLTQPITTGRWYMVAMIVIIGCALAILIERLSIGGLATVRETKVAKRKCMNAFYALCEQGDPSPWAVENKDRMVKEFDRDIKIGWAFGLSGMFLSTLIGDIFWHTIFASLGDWYVVLPMSLACACVIGLTFVHSELFKAILDRVVKAILYDLGVMTAAVAVEEKNMQLDMKVSAMDAVRNDDSVRDPIEHKIGRVVVRRLSGSADNLAEVSLDENSVEGSLLPAPQMKQIASPARGLYPAHKAELGRLLTTNPNMSVGQIAAHFGKSKSTVQEWLNKYKAGL
jgi:hypothetical protein